MKVVRSLPPLVEMMDEIRAWFDSDLGQQLIAAERQAVDGIMPSLFGYHMLQVGIHAQVQLYDKASTGHKFTLLPRLELGMPEAGVVGAPEELPFGSDCIDAVVLHHTLDFAQSPHHVLREAARVLRPGGKMLIVAFNPASLWGVCRWLPGRRDLLPWRGHFIRQGRLHDWLALLELRFERSESAFYRPPMASMQWMSRLQRMESFGGRYLSPYGAFVVTLATKESLATTPLRFGWRRKLALPMSEVRLPRSARVDPVDQKPSVEKVVKFRPR